jgi:hypothetical protein
VPFVIAESTSGASPPTIRAMRVLVAERLRD